jgi:hypothetical protein
MNRLQKAGALALAFTLSGFGVGGTTVYAQERTAVTALETKCHVQKSDAETASKLDAITADAELKAVQKMDGQFCASQLFIYSLIGKNAKVRDAARAALKREGEATTAPEGSNGKP